MTAVVNTAAGTEVVVPVIAPVAVELPVLVDPPALLVRQLESAADINGDKWRRRILMTSETH